MRLDDEFGMRYEVLLRTTRFSTAMDRSGFLVLIRLRRLMLGWNGGITYIHIGWGLKLAGKVGAYRISSDHE